MAVAPTSRLSPFPDGLVRRTDRCPDETITPLAMVQLHMRPTRTDGLATALLALATLAGVALWSQLPAEVAIHFSASGTPDNYVPKAVGVLMLPAIMLGTLVVLRLALRFDPPSDPMTGPVVTVATMGFLGAIHLLVLGWNAGYPVPIDGLLVGSLVWAVLITAYVVRKEGVSWT